MITYRRILVPLDATPAAEQVLPHAISIARSTGAELVLAHVVSARAEVLQQALDGEGTGKTFVDTADELGAQALAHAAAYLPRIQAMLEEAGIPYEVHVIEGDARELLCNLVRDQQIDLVAMTTPSRSMMGRFVHGTTTAETMLRDLDVPVLLLRAENA